MLKEFHIHFDEGQLNNLRSRIDSTRLPGAFKEWNMGFRDRRRLFDDASQLLAQ